MPRSIAKRAAKARAQALRRELDAHAAATPARQLELSLEPYQLIPQIDAWNIRERDQWGQTARVGKKATHPNAGTGFTPAPASGSNTAGGWPVIVERGFAATREGIEALRERLHAEARRRELGQASGTRSSSPTARCGIWRLADDRFPAARQRLDFYHAVQHLAAVGHAVCGEDQAKLQAWLHPLVRQLKTIPP